MTDMVYLRFSLHRSRKRGEDLRPAGMPSHAGTVRLRRCVWCGRNTGRLCPYLRQSSKFSV